METIRYKTGKKPAVFDPHLLHLAHFETATISPKPVLVGYDATAGMGSDFGMLGNDNYGDCGWAGADHETMILTYRGTGIAASFDTATALSDYTSTGFDINAGPPGNNPTDQGTDISQEMKYRRKKGVVDTTGKRHLIGAYIALEPCNWNQLLQGMYAFGVVGFGFAFPDYAMDQFNAHKPWTVVSGAPNPTEGHYVPAVGYPKKNYLEVITWGTRQLMSKAFYQKYNDEAYVFVSTEDLKNGVSPNGYNLSQLNSLLTAIA